jgi:putative ABC transport system permease protein
MNKHPLDSLDGEIRDHIARETQDNIAAGMTPRDARDAARRKFGNVALTAEAARAVWIPVWFDQLRQDVRYGLRMLGRNPGFTLVAVLTLAIGIGLTTAVFSVVNAVLLRPLPYADGERIVLVRETFRDLNRGNASVGHFHDWSEQNTVFEHTAAGQAVTFNLADDGDPERIRGMRVTAGYFQVAYIPPAVGRYFTSDDVEAGERAVVLSYSLWRSRFGGDASIVGRQIRLGGEPYTVVGVAPSAYALTDPARVGVVGGFSAQLWAPLTFPADQRANFGSHYLLVLAKLKPGVSHAGAQADLERVTRGIAERHPKEMESRGISLQLLQEDLAGNVRTQLFVLLAAVGFVLLICCVNIASLLAARATTRRREIAIRAAIGGGQPRIVRQLLTESVVLALAGGLTALIVARLAIDFLVNSGPETLPRLRDAGLQPEVLVFALAVTGMAAVAFGLAPAIRAARTNLQGSLRDGGKTALNGGVRDRMRSVMVVAEIAIAAVLLIGTGLLVRSAEKLQQVPLGFNPHDAITARLTLPAGRYRDDQMVADAYGRILEPLRGAPGVRHAAASTNIPLVGGNADASTVPEGKPMPSGSAPTPGIRLVTDDYFEAIGMTMASGRSFEAADVAAGGRRVVIINERLAAALWPDDTAVGKRLSTWSGPDDPEWREVIGVVRDSRSYGQSSPVPMELFIPYTQPPPGGWNAFQRSMVLVVRTGEDWPETYVPLMRRAVRDVDPTVPLYDVRTMESVVVNVTANRRFYMRLILVLAAAGLGLAMLGIYGVIAYFVTQRTPEIGLRLAMGAGRREVVRMVITHGLRTALIGVAIGVPAALMLTRVMTTLLLEIKPTDPATFVAVAVLLVATSAVASLIPSMKAARVDPLVALRHE